MKLMTKCEAPATWPPDPEYTVIPLADGRECVQLGTGIFKGADIGMPQFHIVMLADGSIYRCSPDELLPAVAE